MTEYMQRQISEYVNTPQLTTALGTGAGAGEGGEGGGEGRDQSHLKDDKRLLTLTETCKVTCSPVSKIQLSNVFHKRRARMTVLVLFCFKKSRDSCRHSPLQ